MMYDYYTANDSIHFFIRFEDNRQVLDIAQTASRLNFSIREGASEKEAAVVSDTLRAISTPADLDGAYFSVTFPASLAAEQRVLHLRLWQKSLGLERLGTLHTIPLRREMGQKAYMILKAGTNMPLFRNYINMSERLVIQHYQEPRPLKLQLYDATFPPALPPMASGQEQVPRTLKIVHTLDYTTGDTVALAEQGLYLAQLAEGETFGLLVRPANYPLVTTAEELIQPLLYMTTSTERKLLYDAQDPKAAVDEFWLKVAGDKNIARDLIRIFYGRVEAANRLFTSHKQGWATDRGMIFIVYGQPDIISHTGNTLTWLYQETASSAYVKFVFNKKQNNFTENHYELVRRREYEESWFSTVAKWRAGATDI